MNNGNDEQENPSSQTEKQNSEASLLILIQELSKLIKEDKEKGKTVWKTGKMLSELKGKSSVKGKKPDFIANFEDDFESLVAENFGLRKDETELRMAIFNGITNSDLITKKMTISHLAQVIRLDDKNAREELLKALREMEKEKDKEKENKNGKYSEPYTVQIIASIVSQYKNYLKEQSNNKKSNDNLPLYSDESYESNKNEESRQIDFSFINALYTERSHSEWRQKEKSNNNRLDIWGPDLKTSYFREIESIYGQEPIDEQGLVGLFCTLFPILKSNNLNIQCLDCLKALKVNKIHQRQLNFSKIKGIRTRFPDAIIVFNICDRNDVKTTLGIRELSVEFEFESFNYIRHEHYDDKVECDLIVCWKHEELSQWERWKKSYFYNKSTRLPFILSVKNLLETGEINLINLNKS
ncbi:hypothetical protein NDI40_17240 [Microcoleus vaginatus ZQ-A3]|uniref:hypothetical protein n=1 Tax=Microcoleus vaginatus TaxID=119532 RepID=UPI00168944EA|nr:hypothetical protein [Microcoleus sp. FACHB-45]